MKTAKRDQIFIFDGEAVLIDTYVLPTVRMSATRGATWTEGSGWVYLATQASVWADLLHGALCEVNWDEIAGSLLDSHAPEYAEVVK